MFDSIFLIQ